MATEKENGLIIHIVKELPENPAAEFTAVVDAAKRQADGQMLVAGKKITGFSWFEETLARRKKVVPFDLEAVLKERGADYRKAWIPMTSKVVVDGTLITGQNPLSSKEMAKVVLNHLTKREIR